MSPVSHKELHSNSKLLISQVVIPQVMRFFLAYLYSTVTQNRNLYPAGRPILFRRPTQKPVGHSKHRKKIGRVLGKNAGEWTGRAEISKEKIPGSKHSMYGYILTYPRLKKENV